MTIEEVGILPDGSGFALMSFKLPDDHWLYDQVLLQNPPMKMRMGSDDPRRKMWEELISEGVMYGIKAATMNGKEDDFDPDALVRNVLIALFGYYTPNGLSFEEMFNPDDIPPIYGLDVKE